MKSPLKINNDIISNKWTQTIRRNNMNKINLNNNLLSLPIINKNLCFSDKKQKSFEGFKVKEDKKSRNKIEPKISNNNILNIKYLSLNRKKSKDNIFSLLKKIKSEDNNIKSQNNIINDDLFNDSFYKKNLILLNKYQNKIKINNISKKSAISFNNIFQSPKKLNTILINEPNSSYETINVDIKNLKRFENINSPFVKTENNKNEENKNQLIIHNIFFKWIMNNLNRSYSSKRNEINNSYDLSMNLLNKDNKNKIKNANIKKIKSANLSEKTIKFKNKFNIIEDNNNLYEKEINSKLLDSFDSIKIINKDNIDTRYMNINTFQNLLNTLSRNTNLKKNYVDKYTNTTNYTNINNKVKNETEKEEIILLSKFLVKFYNNKIKNNKNVTNYFEEIKLDNNNKNGENKFGKPFLLKNKKINNEIKEKEIEHIITDYKTNKSEKIDHRLNISILNNNIMFKENCINNKNKIFNYKNKIPINNKICLTSAKKIKQDDKDNDKKHYNIILIKSPEEIIKEKKTIFGNFNLFKKNINNDYLNLINQNKNNIIFNLKNSKSLKSYFNPYKKTSSGNSDKFILNHHSPYEDNIDNNKINNDIINKSNINTNNSNNFEAGNNNNNNHKSINDILNEDIETEKNFIPSNEYYIKRNNNNNEMIIYDKNGIISTKEYNNNINFNNNMKDYIQNNNDPELIYYNNDKYGNEDIVGTNINYNEINENDNNENDENNVGNNIEISRRRNLKIKNRIYQNIKIDNNLTPYENNEIKDEFEENYYEDLNEDKNNIIKNYKKFNGNADYNDDNNNYNIMEGNNNKLNHRMKKLYFNTINPNEKIIPGNKNKKSVFISPQISSKRRSIKNNFNFKNSEEKEKGILYNPKHVLSENDMINSSSLEKIPKDLDLERILLNKKSKKKSTRKKTKKIKNISNEEEEEEEESETDSEPEFIEVRKKKKKNLKTFRPKNLNNNIDNLLSKNIDLYSRNSLNDQDKQKLIIYSLKLRELSNIDENMKTDELIQMEKDIKQQYNEIISKYIMKKQLKNLIKKNDNKINKKRLKILYEANNEEENDTEIELKIKRKKEKIKEKNNNNYVKTKIEDSEEEIIKEENEVIEKKEEEEKIKLIYDNSYLFNKDQKDEDQNNNNITIKKEVLDILNNNQKNSDNKNNLNKNLKFDNNKTKLNQRNKNINNSIITNNKIINSKRESKIDLKNTIKTKKKKKPREKYKLTDFNDILENKEEDIEDTKEKILENKIKMFYDKIQRFKKNGESFNYIEFIKSDEMVNERKISRLTNFSENINNNLKDKNKQSQSKYKLNFLSPIQFKSKIVEL